MNTPLRSWLLGAKNLDSVWAGSNGAERYALLKLQ